MKIRLALSTLEFNRVQIHVSTTTVSSIFITWVKLMSRQLWALIVWPSLQQVKKLNHHVSESFIPKSDA